MSASGSDSGDEPNECEDKLDKDDSDAQDKVRHNDLLSFHSLIINHRSLKTSLTTSLC